MGERLKGKRVLLTQASAYMGPITAQVFAEEGAEVLADDGDLASADACRALVAGSAASTCWWRTWRHRTSAAPK